MWSSASRRIVAALQPRRRGGAAFLIDGERALRRSALMAGGILTASTGYEGVIMKSPRFPDGSKTPSGKLAACKTLAKRLAVQHFHGRLRPHRWIRGQEA